MPASKKKKGNGSLRAGDNSVVVGGNVQGSNIIVGNDNVVMGASLDFSKIYRYVERHPKLTPTEKEDVKAELQEVEKEAQKGEKADETFLARRFRNIGRMAPDIVDVTFETLKNPISGMATVIQKIARKMAEEAGGRKQSETGG